MSRVLRAVVLVGSPRAGGSTSATLARALTAGLESEDVACERWFVQSALADADRWAELGSALAAADLVLLACPLYVDSLPGPVTLMLERLRDERFWGDRRPGFALVVNCGFPEAIHNQTAIAIARLFAHEAGLEWRGALALGGGEAIAGRALERLGRRAEHVQEALKLAATELAAGRAVPSEAVRLMSRPLIPPWIYRAVASFSMRRRARHHGAHASLRARPFE